MPKRIPLDKHPCFGATLLPGQRRVFGVNLLPPLAQPNTNNVAKTKIANKTKLFLILFTSLNFI